MYVFSYWIFTWFLVYYIFRSRTIPSPKLALMFGAAVNLIEWFYLFYANAAWIHILQFTFVNGVVKLLPIYLLWNVPLQLPYDLYTLLAALTMYAAVCFAVGGTEFIEDNYELTRSYVENRVKTYPRYLLDSIFT